MEYKLNHRAIKFGKKWIVGLLIPALAACLSPGIAELQQQADELAAKYAPDKRTGIAVFELIPAGRGKILLQGETLYPGAKSILQQMIRSAGYEMTDSLKILPDPAGPGPWGLISVSVANIRAKPSHAAELATQAVLGTPVRIIRKQGGWLQIQTPDFYIGWTTSSSLELAGEAKMAAWRQSDRVMFQEICGNIMDSPSGIEVVSDLVAGSLVVQKSELSGFMEVELPDGRTGFAKKQSFVRFQEWKDTVTATPQGISRTARRFNGLPYMWGGTSSKALDCSGFTRTVYFLHGIILERDASQQIRHGRKVSPENHFSELQPGDLLFYGTKEPFRVVHVGIWTEENGVIHASGRVKTEYMDPESENFSTYLHDTFLGEIRRVAGYTGSIGIIKVSDHPWY